MGEFFDDGKRDGSWPCFDGYTAQQSRFGLNLIGKILNDNPDILRIVELGTGHGGTSLFLGSRICGRGGKVLTIDIAQLMDHSYSSWNLSAQKYNVTFLQKDVFLPETVQEVSNFIKDHRALIFCDDGVKKREFPLYAEILKKDDLLLAHDYTGEISDKDLTERTLAILEPYRQEEFSPGVLDTRILSMKRR